jgi:hypothetical protein
VERRLLHDMWQGSKHLHDVHMLSTWLLHSTCCLHAVVLASTVMNYEHDHVFVGTTLFDIILVDMCNDICIVATPNLWFYHGVSPRWNPCGSSWMLLYRHVTCERSYEHVLLLLYAQYVNMSCHVSCVMCHASSVMRHVSWVVCSYSCMLNLSYVMCHVSCVNMSCFICHKRASSYVEHI